MLRREDLDAATWAAEAVDAMPLRWDAVRSPVALAHLMATLDDAFGDDLAAWSTALRLFDGWVGTPADLVATSRAVLSTAG